MTAGDRVGVGGRHEGRLPVLRRRVTTEGPTRSGPVRPAATPRPTVRATPAARPAPLHPTQQATAAKVPKTH
jgi:hypothetical protein